jgi:hypothetical protein
MADNATAKRLFWPLALLILIVVADVALTSALGTACGSGLLCGPGDGRTQPARLARYLRDVWPHQPYLPGESSADLWALSLVRTVASLLLAASVFSSALQARRRAAAPDLLLPLQAAEAQNSSAATSTAVDGTGGPSGHPPATALPTANVSAGWRRWLPSPHSWSLVLLSVSGIVLAGKAFSRLLQSGVGGPGTGALPLEGTTPQEPWWWAALIAGAVSSLCEHFAIVSLCRAQPTPPARSPPSIGAGEPERNAGTRGGGGGGGRVSGGGKAEEDPMLGLKKAYLDASMPRVRPLPSCLITIDPFQNSPWPHSGLAR